MGTDGFDSLDDIHTVNDFSEDAVLSVQPWGSNGADKELGSVGVWTSVSHGQNTRLIVLLAVVQVLIGELGSVDGFSSSSVTGGEVTSLAHKLWDHTVEGGPFEVQWLSHLSHTLFTSAQSSEVSSGLRNDIIVQLEGNFSDGSSPDLHIKENVGHLVDLFVIPKLEKRV